MFKDQGDLYVLGQLEDEGEKQNFLDLTTHFVDGLKQSVIEDKEPYVYIHLGGETMNLEKAKNEEDEEDEEDEG